MPIEADRIRIFIADDHRWVIEGVKTVLANYNNIQIVGEAIDANEAIKQVLEIKPDIVLMDIAFGPPEKKETSGLEATKKITTELETIDVINLTFYEERGFVFKAFDNGARGYVYKSSPPIEMLSAIDLVTKGGRYFPPGVSHEDYIDYLRQKNKKIDPYNSFKEVEKEVYLLVAEGFHSKDISEKIHRGIRQVERLRKKIMDDLGFHNQADLIKDAIRRGIIKLP